MSCLIAIEIHTHSHHPKYKTFCVGDINSNSNQYRKIFAMVIYCMRTATNGPRSPHTHKQYTSIYCCAIAKRHQLQQYSLQCISIPLPSEWSAKVLGTNFHVMWYFFCAENWKRKLCLFIGFLFGICFAWPFFHGVCEMYSTHSHTLFHLLKQQIAMRLSSLCSECVCICACAWFGLVLCIPSKCRMKFRFGKFKFRNCGILYRAILRLLYASMRFIYQQNKHWKWSRNQAKQHTHWNLFAN